MKTERAALKTFWRIAFDVISKDVGNIPCKTGSRIYSTGECSDPPSRFIRPERMPLLKKTTWGQISIGQLLLPSWASEGFFPGEGSSGFFQTIFRVGQTWLHLFSLVETKKTNHFCWNCQNQWGRWPFLLFLLRWW